jgi:hypothetical protein
MVGLCDSGTAGLLTQAKTELIADKVAAHLVSSYANRN